MEQITHIVDMDGFIVDKIFLCKELSIIDVRDGSYEHATFQLGKSFHYLSNADKKSALYVSNFIHGIPFKDFGYEKYRQDQIFDVIQNFLHSCANPIVAYKGGCFERDILQKMSMKSINLEEFGCPKFDVLIQNPLYKITTEPCPLHCWRMKKPSLKPHHCCLREVQTFRAWLNNM